MSVFVSSAWRPLAHQRGFSLIEVSIVTAIMILLAIIGIPAIGSYVVENKVPKVGEDLARFILQVKVNASGTPEAAYADIDTSHFANLVRDSGVFSVAGTGATARVLHGLGGDGMVTVAPRGMGESFAIELTNVSHAACPALASVMQRVADVITVAAQGAPAVTVKDAATTYSALATESLCVQGDRNTFTFIVG